MDKSVCVHCNHEFDLNNLKNERRRDVRKLQGEIDIMQILASCYGNDDFVSRLRAFESTLTDCFVCNKCFLNIKSLDSCAKKCANLKQTLKCSGSDRFKNALSCSTIIEDISCENDTVQECEPPLSAHSPSLRNKRPREVLTPVKTGCTPKGKRIFRTNKTNRRKLLFSGDTSSRCSPRSPGPKVKVQISFDGSTRNSNMRGHDKMVCRAIVMRQYRSALNHFMNIEDAKQNIVEAVKKTICKELTMLCKMKTCVLRSENLSNFSWMGAFNQIQTTCPTMTDILTSISGVKKIHVPRIVSSLCVLLFTRNRSMGALQAINSVLMFRGNVRTKVYSSFNRAGLCKSYKSTITTVDKTCEGFDEPVKIWAKNVELAKTTSENVQDCYDSALVDHEYAAPQSISLLNESQDELESDATSETPTLHPEPALVDHEYAAPQSISLLNESQDELESDATSETPTLHPEPEFLLTPDKGHGSPVEDVESPYTTTLKEMSHQQTTHGFQIIMDNLNMHQKTRHNTSESKNKVHNLTHSIAVEHRVNSSGLDDMHPQADLMTIPDEAFIPSEEDHTALYSDMNHLIKRVLVENLPAFEDFSAIVSPHIGHEFSKESSKKSNIIPLGILEKDENITEQMIEIVEHLQQYVPKNKNKMLPLLLGGDSLSVERGESSKLARGDAVTPEERLDGFEWKSEDWHAHVTSLQDTFSLHFKGSSAAEKGTLFQLRNYFDWRGVKFEVKDAVNDCREFLRFVTKGLIIVAAMKVLKMTSITDKPTMECDSNEERSELIQKVSNEITQQFIVSRIIRLSDKEESGKQKFPCGFTGCTRSFALDGKCRKKHRQICVFKHKVVVTSNSVVEEPTADYKFNYSCSLLRDGLMDWCREDAAKENDGKRLVRMWKFDMLRYFHSNHTKYRLHAFRLQAQLMALLPPKLAHQLLHNRCVNIHGGAGRNVPGDLALEFMNMRAKDSLHSLHGNLTSTSIQRCGRSLQGCNDLVDTYTSGLGQYFGKPSNSKPCLKKDIKKLVNHLMPEELFQNTPGRRHKSFEKFCFDPVQKLNCAKLKTWISEKKEHFSKLQRSRSYFT